MNTLFPPVSRDDKCRVKMEKQGKTGEDESEPSINLGLWIGGPKNVSFDHHRLKNSSFVSGSGRSVKVEVDGGDDQVAEEREKWRCREFSVVCFTGEQLEELNTQILIFKYMLSGLPGPAQLLPLSSLFALHHCFDKQYMMDPELGRCRRTDGKKWRCHKSVVPNEKYCENHMHRGRKRSRKLVEASTEAAPPNLQTRNPMNLNGRDRPNDVAGIKVPANLDTKPHFPIYTSPWSSCSSFNSYIEVKDAPTKVLIRAPSLSDSTVKIYENDRQNDIGKHNYTIKPRINGINLSSGLDFSPKSVLQGDLKSERVEKCDNDPNSEPGRCRRTDGKKWRCSKRVLPNQKYCANHVNRGSKKPTVPLSTCGAVKPPCGSTPLAKQSKIGLGLDTSLSFSLSTGSANPQHSSEDDSVVGSDESGSTTDTTATDDSTGVSNMIPLSP